MSNFKDRRNFYVVTKNYEDFIKAKLILECYFHSNIKQGLSYYKSRILVVNTNGNLSCYMNSTLIRSDHLKLKLEDLINHY